ncbi:hypothetical protein [Pseudoalteromonas aliena]|uniref:hypothetical protein n=1 Tax=Pseudoalteromonas aliena TaxID=247523 RepID=UPI001F23EC72|nr:hypothetical protein [Pseudoalteromonas aliena]
MGKLFYYSLLLAYSATATLASDYLFNYVSQTQEGTDIEANAYTGYYTSLTDLINLDIDIAQ